MHDANILEPKSSSATPKILEVMKLGIKIFDDIIIEENLIQSPTERREN